MKNANEIKKCASDFDAKIVSEYWNSITFQVASDDATKCLKRLFMVGIGASNVLVSELSKDPLEIVEQVTRITVFSR